MRVWIDVYRNIIVWHVHTWRGILLLLNTDSNSMSLHLEHGLVIMYTLNYNSRYRMHYLVIELWIFHAFTKPCALYCSALDAFVCFSFPFAEKRILPVTLQYWYQSMGRLYSHPLPACRITNMDQNRKLLQSLLYRNARNPFNLILIKFRYFCPISD